MAKKKFSDFPYAELEFTSPADQLIQLVEQYFVRIKGEKLSRKEVLEYCKLVLENRP